jgi:hypothetical protein
MLNALISNVPSNAAGAGQGAANKGSVPSGFALLTQPKPQTTEITAETSVVAVDTPPSTALPEVMALLAEMLGSVKWAMSRSNCWIPRPLRKLWPRLD